MGKVEKIQWNIFFQVEHFVHGTGKSGTFIQKWTISRFLVEHFPPRWNISQDSGTFRICKENLRCLSYHNNIMPMEHVIEHIYGTWKKNSDSLDVVFTNMRDTVPE